MKRSESHKKINRNNNTIFNHLNFVPTRRIFSPDINVDHIWLDEDLQSGVQIIEVNSSEQAQRDEETAKFGDIYNYIDQARYQDDVNENARERRRAYNRNQSHYTTSDFGAHTHDDNAFAEYLHGRNCNDIKRDGVFFNHQMNCFTIIDKHYLINSQTSSDEEITNMEAEVEEIKRDSIFECNSNPSEEEIITYFPDIDAEKRLIWIYSFKNKRLLSENEFELVNIPSTEGTSSSGSPVDANERITKNTRVPTPMPPSYVPRLNLTLTPTLPTVTEVTEPNRQSSANQTDRSSIESVRVRQKLRNNWFLSENVPSTGFTNKNKTTSIVNWMALSPREKRRQFRNTHPPLLPSVKEASTYVEENLLTRENSTNSRRHIVSKIRAAIGNDSARNSDRTLLSGDTIVEKIKNDLLDTGIQWEDECTPEDRGDHNKRSKHIEVPQIRFSPKPISTAEISEPIEKLDGNNWIGETNTRKTQCPGFTKHRRPFHGELSSNTLLIRNMSLLQPAHWAEYLPIADSVPSLHLSFNTDSEVEPRSWFKRFRRIFKCCK